MARDLIEQIKIHTDSVVKGFFDDYRWLSNYHICDITYRGLTFSSSEAAYQSAKTNDQYTKELVQKMTPTESKKFGKEVRVNGEWHRIKKGVMEEILRDKFTRNSDLRNKLLETGSKYLEETNYWGDTFWGVCEGKGKNVLGELLMKIRKELQNGLI